MVLGVFDRDRHEGRQPGAAAQLLAARTDAADHLGLIADPGLAQLDSKMQPPGQLADQAPADCTAQVPVPGETLRQYYEQTNPHLLVRFDVTYLRQDFSVTLPAKKIGSWPSMQRYDFVVRTREVNEQEARAWRDLLPAAADSPYRRAALAAIAQLSGSEPAVKSAR